MADETPREKDILDAITPFAGMIGHGIDALRAPVATPTPETTTPADARPIHGAGGTIAVTRPGGDVAYVAPDDLELAQAHGAHVATQPEYYNSKLGATGKAAVFGIGAAQGASFDFAAPLAIGIAKMIGADESAETLKRGMQIAQEASPTAYHGGSFVGALAPALLGAPEGAAVEGEGLLGRAAGRFANALPRAAAEGAAFGVGHELTEDTLGDHAVTAEKLLASANGGAMFGGLLGGGLAAGGGALADAGSALMKHAGAEDGAFRWLGRKAADAAEEQAFKATGAKAPEIRKLGATVEDQAAEERRLGRLMLDENLTSPTASRTEIANRVEKRLDEVGQELDAMRKPLDKSSVRPDMLRMAQDFEQRVTLPLTGRTNFELQSGMSRDAGGLFGDLEFRPAADAFERILKRAGDSPSFETLHNLRRELDTELTKSYARVPGAPIPRGEDAMRELRRVVEDEYTRAGEEAAQELGGGFEAKYKLAKSLYGDLSTVNEILGKSAARETGNAGLSLTDVISGHEALAGHPLALVGMGANMIRRHYGNQIAAHVLDKTAQLMGVQRAAAHVDGLITKGVKGFLEGGTSGAAIAKKTKPVTPDDIAAIRGAVANPEALTAQVAKTVGGADLKTNAPNISQALATTIQRAAVYAAHAAPPEPKPVGISVLPQKPRAPSASDMTRFQNVIEAINDPLSVVDDLRHGRLNRDKVDAIRNVYPQLYNQIRNEITKQAIDMQPDLTGQQEIAISVLFQTPLSPQFRAMSSFQATFAGPDPTKAPQDGGNPAPGPRSFDRARASLASPTDQMENASA